MTKVRNPLEKKLLSIVETQIVYKKNEIISDQGLKNKNILILIKGAFKVSHIMMDGKELTFGIYNGKHSNYVIPSSIEGFGGIASLFQIRALEDCIFGSIEFDIRKLNDYKIFGDFLRYYDFLCQRVYLQMRDLAIHRNKEKLYSILIRLVNTYGKKENNRAIISVPTSNLVLAEYMGSAPETVSRLLQELIKKGLIKRSNGKIIINDISYMESILGCSSCKNNICEL